MAKAQLQFLGVLLNGMNEQMSHNSCKILQGIEFIILHLLLFAVKSDCHIFFSDDLLINIPSLHLSKQNTQFSLKWTSNVGPYVLRVDMEMQKQLLSHIWDVFFQFHYQVFFYWYI